MGREKLMVVSGEELKKEDDMTFYKSVTVNKKTYRVHDNVKLALDNPDDFYYGEIVSIFDTLPGMFTVASDEDTDTDSDDSFQEEEECPIAVKVRWFYRVHEIDDLAMEFETHSSEMFWSLHTDDNPATALAGHFVIHYDWLNLPPLENRVEDEYYCRFIYDNLNRMIYRLSIDPRSLPEEKAEEIKDLQLRVWRAMNKDERKITCFPERECKFPPSKTPIGSFKPTKELYWSTEKDDEPFEPPRKMQRQSKSPEEERKEKERKLKELERRKEEERLFKEKEEERRMKEREREREKEREREREAKKKEAKKANRPFVPPKKKTAFLDTDDDSDWDISELLSDLGDDVDAPGKERKLPPAEVITSRKNPEETREKMRIIKDMKASEWTENTRVGKRMCQNYLKGDCTKGAKCKFYHPTLVEDEVVVAQSDRQRMREEREQLLACLLTREDVQRRLQAGQAEQIVGAFVLVSVGATTYRLCQIEEAKLDVFRPYEVHKRPCTHGLLVNLVSGVETPADRPTELASLQQIVKLTQLSTESHIADSVLAVYKDALQKYRQPFPTRAQLSAIQRALQSK